jgi:hypothetical protein
MKRAFSADGLEVRTSWGVAPGWHENAPLALSRYRLAQAPLNWRSPLKRRVKREHGVRHAAILVIANLGPMKIEFSKGNESTFKRKFDR